MLTKVNLAEAFAGFTDTWSPKVAGDINDAQVKLVKLEGEFTWHHHEDEDELFLVVAGRMRMDLEDGAIDLGPGEMVVVPRGVEHRPVALPTADVLLVEPATTLNTGTASGDERTVERPERLPGA